MVPRLNKWFSIEIKKKFERLQLLCFGMFCHLRNVIVAEANENLQVSIDSVEEPPIQRSYFFSSLFCRCTLALLYWGIAFFSVEQSKTISP